MGPKSWHVLETAKRFLNLDQVREHIVQDYASVTAELDDLDMDLFDDDEAEESDEDSVKRNYKDLKQSMTN